MHRVTVSSTKVIFTSGRSFPRSVVLLVEHLWGTTSRHHAGTALERDFPECAYMTKEEREQIENRAEEANRQEHTQVEKEKYSARIFREIANTCKPRSIQMVEDLPGNHETGYLPILDTAMKVEGGQIHFIHYSKPMSSLEVVSGRSAMSQGS